MSDHDVSKRLYATDDGSVWAREFVAMHGGDEGLMIGWFANAIEAAKRITLKQHPERKAVHDSDFVVLPREALFEFFGQVALPPWQDADGRWIGGDIDCAPLASTISDWVTQHDLGDLYRPVASDAPTNRAGTMPVSPVTGASIDDAPADSPRRQ